MRTMQSDNHAMTLQASNAPSYRTTLQRRMEPSQPCRVLIVDDDELVRARLSSVLRASQFDVELAASAEDALLSMNERRHHILLTDWQMPDMDGLSLCRKVRQRRCDGYIYVLMHTVRNGRQDLLAGLAAGADDYLVKGVPIEELLARMEVARRISSAESAMRLDRNDSNGALATSDALTGANNLCYLLKHLPRELARSRRYGHTLAVLSCDIDGFKEINDRLGYEAGDAVLRAFIARAENCIRKDSDWLARVADDEFMIVLPETNVHGAHRVAQKLRESFAKAPVHTGAGPVIFTASIGMTAIEPKHERDGKSRLEDVFRAAGRGLHASQKRGGDHVTASTVGSHIAIGARSRKEGHDDFH
jgi:two-component system, cell cycle response regulator